MANDFKDFSELKACVERNSGLLTETMASLRDAQGASKLGRYIVEGIIDNLKQQGLKAYPSDLPLLQHECVRVYTAGTPISKLFDAVMTLEAWDDMDANYEADQVIREMVDGEAQETLKQIRALVCG